MRTEAQEPPSAGGTSPASRTERGKRLCFQPLACGRSSSVIVTAAPGPTHPPHPDVRRAGHGEDEPGRVPPPPVTIKEGHCLGG